MNGRIAVLTFAVFLSLALAVPAVAAGPYYTTLGCSQPSYSAPTSLSFTSSSNSVQIYITLPQGTTFTSLSATVGVGQGGSVTFSFTDPNGIAQGTNTASGATAAVTAQNPISGQWVLTITGTIPAGQTIPVSAVVQSTPVNCTTTTTTTTPPLNDWLIITILVVVIIIVVGISLFVMRGRGKEAALPPAMPSAGKIPPTPSGGTTVYAPGTQVVQKGTQQYYAGLELPGGQVIPVTSMSQDFGRGDFENVVPKEVSNIISRRHFQISFAPRDKTFYIEDIGSTNGTKVNGTDIKGKGKYPLKTGDVISPADVLNLKFKG